MTVKTDVLNQDANFHHPFKLEDVYELNISILDFLSLIVSKFWNCVYRECARVCVYAHFHVWQS